MKKISKKIQKNFRPRKKNRIDKWRLLNGFKFKFWHNLRVWLRVTIDT